MTLINASLPLLVGQTPVAQHVLNAAESNPELQHVINQAHSLENLVKARESIDKVEDQAPTEAVGKDGQNQADAEAQPRRRRRHESELEALAPTRVEAPLEDALAGRIVNMDI